MQSISNQATRKESSPLPFLQPAASRIYPENGATTLFASVDSAIQIRASFRQATWRQACWEPVENPAGSRFPGAALAQSQQACPSREQTTAQRSRSSQVAAATGAARVRGERAVIGDRAILRARSLRWSW